MSAKSMHTHIKGDGSHGPFVRCPLCHDPERPDDMVGGVCLTCADGIAFAQNARRGAVIVPLAPSPPNRRWGVAMSCCGKDEGTATFTEWAHADAFRSWWVDNGPSVTHMAGEPDRAAVIRRTTVVAVHINDGSAEARAMAWSEGYSEGYAARRVEP